MYGDFSGHDLIADYVTGRRTWDVDGDGTLVSPVNGYEWKPGMNHAGCWGEDWLPHHRLAGSSCGCGFYAYVRGVSPYQMYGRLTGIIRGTGTATCGSKGFRVENAEVVALVTPTVHEWLWRWCWVIFGVGITAGIFSAASLHWLWLTIASVACWMVGLWYAVERLLDYHIDAEAHLRRQTLARVRERYPDVKWYPTMWLARRAFPLSRFPDPAKAFASPETRTATEVTESKDVDAATAEAAVNSDLKVTWRFDG